VMPLVAIVGDKYLALHGGPPTRMDSLADFEKVDAKGLEEILWSDPMEEDGVYPSLRGAGVLFGPGITRKALKVTGTKILVRGHTPCDYGACPSQGGLTLTLFTRLGAPYFNKAAAYVEVDMNEGVKDSYELASKARKLKL